MTLVSSYITDIKTYFGWVICDGWNFFWKGQFFFNPERENLWRKARDLRHTTMLKSFLIDSKTLIYVFPFFQLGINDQQYFEEAFSLTSIPNFIFQTSSFHLLNSPLCIRLLYLSWNKRNSALNWYVIEICFNSNYLSTHISRWEYFTLSQVLVSFLFSEHSDLLLFWLFYSFRHIRSREH